MDKSQLTIILAVVSSLAGIVSFFVVRWMNRVDGSLQKWSDREIQDAAYTARIEGQIENLQKCISQSNKDIGTLSASVQKIWDVVISQKLADQRPSDKIIGQQDIG